MAIDIRMVKNQKLETVYARVLDHIARARDQGQAVILITHNFRHALSVADDLTVLVQGCVAAHFRRDQIELDELTDLVARVG